MVACGRQQNAASTPLQSTSAILTSRGTLVAVTKCGNTSENACKLKTLDACCSLA